MKWQAALVLFVLTSCKTATNYYQIPTYKNETLQAVIEIPAGTNVKIEYNKTSNRFLADQINGKTRIINFLGYPGNYGFIPSTYSDPKKGGDGDALDILVLSESVPTNTVQAVIPIAVIKLIDAGEQDYKIIAIPQNVKKRTINATTFKEFVTKYEAAKKVLELWFTHYDTHDPIVISGWGDEQQAFEEINKWASKTP